jgi:hypothetical protein
MEQKPEHITLYGSVPVNDPALTRFALILGGFAPEAFTKETGSKILF